MLKRAAFLIALSLVSVVLLAGPQEKLPIIWPPLPPELPPEYEFLGPFTPKQFLPHPGTSTGYRWPSGAIPERCRKVYDLKTPRILDCWLEANPTIAHAIQWDGRRWDSWTPKQRDELRSLFQTVRNWRASGYGPWPGPAFDEPPVNREAPFLADNDLRTVIDSNEARQRFFAQIAVMLASEIDAWVPWSLHDYSPAVLEELFGTLYQFERDRDDGGSLDSVYHGYIVTSGVTPAHVATLYRFFIDEGIIRPTAIDTIARLLEWCRDHMLHYYDIGVPPVPVGPQYEAFWHYRGFPPVARILEGTVVTGLPPASWTAGCSGTTRFLRSVLRVLNIPVREILRPETGGHAVPFFASEGLYLSHGDDPYGQHVKTGDFTGRDLFLTTDDWMRWFPPGSMGENVGRRTVDLNLVRPSRYVVGAYCADQRDGLSRADGRVLAFASHFYTLADLEARRFYDLLAGLAETSSEEDCVRWRAER